MIIILFLHLLFGLYFAHHIYQSRTFFSYSEHTIKACVFGYLILLFTCSFFSTPILFFAIYFPLALFLFFEWFDIYKVKKSFKIQIIIVLDAIISRMKLGNSFREACLLSIHSIEKKQLKKDFKEIYDRMIYQQPLAPQVLNEYIFTYNIFLKADQDLQPLSQLHYVRHTLKIETLFQRKSKQALLQIYLQSLILLGMYLPLLVFIIAHYGYKYLYFIFFSLFLFCLGTFFVFIGGQKIKWSL